MSTTTTTRMLPNALHFSEFQGGYHGTCGETALATAMVCASPPIENTQDAINLMLSMTKQMISLGWADGSGATTTQHLHDEAIKRGFVPDNASFVSFHQPLDPTTLHNLLLSNAGVRPIVLEIARAGVLPGDEAGVQYHFICVVGITPSGYVVNDGDNSAAPSHLVTYSWAEIEAAVPCGALMLDMQEGVPSVLDIATVSGFFSANADGSWQSKDGFRVEGDILAFYRSLPGAHAGLTLIGLPTGAMANPQPNVWIQPFERAVVISDSHHAIDNPPGSLGTYLAHIDQGMGYDLVTANLQKQLAEAKATQTPAPAPVPAPAPAPLDPAVRNALAAALQLLQPQMQAAQDIQQAIAKLPA